MIKRAPRPDYGFLILRNDVARDKRLSYRARGLLAAILSRPDNWTLNAEQLAAEAEDGEGIKAVQAGLRELEKAGYLERRRVRVGKGQFAWEQIVYDSPKPGPTINGSYVSAGQTISPKPPGGFPPDGFRSSKEEPRRSTEEEDVTAPYCTSSGRFAPSAGGEEGDQQSVVQTLTGSNEPDVPELGIENAPTTDWRSEDRALFQSLVGDQLTSDGSVYTHSSVTTYPHAWSVDVWYNVFRKRQKRPIKWPGKFLESLDDCNPRNGIDDWLMDLGLERA